MKTRLQFNLFDCLIVTVCVAASLAYFVDRVHFESSCAVRADLVIKRWGHPKDMLDWEERLVAVKDALSDKDAIKATVALFPYEERTLARKHLSKLEVSRPGDSTFFRFSIRGNRWRDSTEFCNRLINTHARLTLQNTDIYGARLTALDAAMARPVEMEKHAMVPSMFAAVFFLVAASLGRHLIRSIRELVGETSGPKTQPFT